MSALEDYKGLSNLNEQKGQAVPMQPELNNFVQTFEKEVVVLREVKEQIQYSVKQISNRLQPSEENPNKRKSPESGLDVCWDMLENLREVRRDFEDIRRQLQEIAG